MLQRAADEAQRTISARMASTKTSTARKNMKLPPKMPLYSEDLFRGVCRYGFPDDLLGRQLRLLSDTMSRGSNRLTVRSLFLIKWAVVTYTDSCLNTCPMFIPGLCSLVCSKRIPSSMKSNLGQTGALSRLHWNHFPTKVLSVKMRFLQNVSIEVPNQGVHQDLAYIELLKGGKSLLNLPPIKGLRRDVVTHLCIQETLIHFRTVYAAIVIAMSASASSATPSSLQPFVGFHPCM